MRPKNNVSLCVCVTEREADTQRQRETKKEEEEEEGGRGAARKGEAGRGGGREGPNPAGQAPHWAPEDLCFASSALRLSCTATRSSPNLPRLRLLAREVWICPCFSLPPALPDPPAPRAATPPRTPLPPETTDVSLQSLAEGGML